MSLEIDEGPIKILKSFDQFTVSNAILIRVGCMFYNFCCSLYVRANSGYINCTITN